MVLAAERLATAALPATVIAIAHGVAVVVVAGVGVAAVRSRSSAAAGDWPIVLYITKPVLRFAYSMVR